MTPEQQAVVEAAKLMVRGFDEGDILLTADALRSCKAAVRALVASEAKPLRAGVGNGLCFYCGKVPQPGEWHGRHDCAPARKAGGEGE